ncbi:MULTISPECIES: hypothetical protein [Rhodococcus]|jgi:hypothetical protein|uniref:Secreted protein n=1 Tax=Rhodococcus cercidiphylli TaxID=489916 RepID=A0ABU4B4I9_9NOCA|nr:MULTISPECIES: hypothetical protein [Rhodococcus]KAA0926302.1 hypothetical protein FQ188_05750 [Rhodococcus sp. ANT_H53B]MDI6630472.1 hypothetical protein [Rhodococcus sp. (in: high G+C Gram-positive bacteria)]MDI9924439.1 hypothetical protein [Rhodococcus sp. IEGM 1341]MDV6233363.1 hypothetical protein [Rhodococcus cercidiphylli]MDV8057107.1 hypothetical protein [Rhodococcus sp. IEGM 1343]
MDTSLAVFAVVAGFAVVLGAFVLIARILRSRMRRGRFHGIESAVGGSAFMGAPRERGITPPDHGDPRTNAEQSEP